MADLAYTNVPGKLKPFFQKIKEVGVPAKASQNWLASVGYASTNDRSMLGVLKQLGFTDASGTPSSRWISFRGPHGEKELATGIKEGYAAIFEVYPDAHKRSAMELESVVRSKEPKLAKETVSRVVSTFRALVEISNFETTNGAPEGESTSTSTDSDLNPGVTLIADPKSHTSVLSGLSINVNVQLTLPETTDSTVYEKLFAAMREHLIDQISQK